MANENIYGGQTYINSSFVFDKTYPNYAQAQDDATEDGVLLGRYVLIKYCDTAFSQDERIHIEAQDDKRPNTEDAREYYKNYQADNGVSKDRIMCRKEWIVGEDRVGKFGYREIANLSTTCSKEVFDDIGTQLNNINEQISNFNEFFVSEEGQTGIDTLYEIKENLEKRPIFIRTENNSEIFNNGPSSAIPSDIDYGHAEGKDTKVERYAGHAEGYKTKVMGVAGHAEGNNTLAAHDGSHTSGSNTKTSRANQTVIGEYNSDNSEALFIVGNGGAYTQVPSDEIFNVDKIYYIKIEGTYKKQEGLTGFQDGVIYYIKNDSAIRSNAFEVYDNGTTTPCYKIIDDKSATLSFVLGGQESLLAKIEDWEIEEHFNKYVLKAKSPIYLDLISEGGNVQITQDFNNHDFISIEFKVNDQETKIQRFKAFGNLNHEDQISGGFLSLFTRFDIEEDKLKWNNGGHYYGDSTISDNWHSNSAIWEINILYCEIEIAK